MVQDPESGHYALPEVMKAYWDLKKKAQEDHWHLILVSGYRSFKSQRRIWNTSDEAYLKKGATDQKKRVEAVMSLASVPGLSRHHWGTDLDISEISLRGQLVNIEEDTPEKVLKFYRWMEDNAPKFGFCKVYLGKEGLVKHEPWHWTYLPFSKTYQKGFLGIGDFKRIFDINIEDVDYLMRNFKKILNNYNRSVNPACL
jgi:LAS superfamily LD-carboxypeptidase LdcB